MAIPLGEIAVPCQKRDKAANNPRKINFNQLSNGFFEDEDFANRRKKRYSRLLVKA